MGRPPCCDKVGIKKGPWTPEEDIILVSYIQEHGPGNWRSVPTNTGLLRCSKSCRLRWTNYLRPGIKRGNFNPREEGMIIHLQALLGNKWAAIASYLPQRTDNDIKNYWNTHLKKKLKKFHAALDPHLSSNPTISSHFLSKSFSGSTYRTSLDISSHGTSTTELNYQISSTTTYASSTENISRLLEGWMRSSPKIQEKQHQNNNLEKNCSHGNARNSVYGYRPKAEEEEGALISHEEFESILSFENLTNVAWDKYSSCDSSSKGSQSATNEESNVQIFPERKKKSSAESSAAAAAAPPLSFLEKWLLDESAVQVEEMMGELSPIC